MRKLNFLLLLCTTASCMLSGCAQRAAVRESARTLQHSMMLYEQRLDGLITSQQTYYQARSSEYRKAHSLLIKEGGQQKVIQQAAQLADRFSSNPGSNVSIPELISFLHESDQSEYELQTRIRKDLADKESEFQSSLRNLERDRDTATLVRQNLGRIGRKQNLKDEVLHLKDYAKDVHANMEKPKTQDNK